MRFNSIEGRGWVGLRKPFKIDLNALNGTIIGLTGPNGSGKSSFVELLIGAMYRSMPTRGNLVNFAVDKDAYVQVSMTNGNDYIFRQLVDAERGKVEAVVMTPSSTGEDEYDTLIKSAKINEYRDWAKDNLPAQSVIFSSIFAPQESNGFVDLGRTERMAVLLRVLGIERYEAMSTSAGKKASAINGTLKLNQTRLNDYGALALITGDEATSRAQSEVDAAAKVLATTETELLAAKEALEAVSKEISAARDKIAENAGMRESLVTARARVTELETREADLTSRIESYSATLKNAKAIEKAKKTATDLTTRIASFATTIQGIDTEKKLYDAAIASKGERSDQITKDLTETNKRIAAALQRQSERPQIEAAVKALPDAETALSRATEAKTAAQTAKDQLTANRFDDETARSLRLRTGIETIATDHNVEPRSYAVSLVREDDKQLDQRAQYPGLLAEANAALKTAEVAETEARRKRDDLQRLADKAKDLATAVETEQSERATLETLRAEQVRLRDEVQELATKSRGYETQIKKHQTSKSRLETQLTELGDVETPANELLAAQAGSDELKRELGDVQAQLISARRIVRALPEVEPDPTVPDDTAIKQRVTTAESAFLEARLEHQSKTTALNDTKTKVASLEALRSEIARDQSEMTQWERLRLDFSRDGIQAMEIDAAAPQLTDLINDLLHTCFGTRWTVKVEIGADEGKVRENVDVMVEDSQHTGPGRIKEARMLSGGERTIVGEACSLALAILACKRAGVEGATLIRDESGAALDARYEDHATQYLAMLRRAAEIVKASKVLFVSHGPEITLADSWLRFNKGEITICNSWDQLLAAA